MKKHFLSFIILALTLGWSANAWAYTFKSGTVIYVDMTAITKSDFTAHLFVDHGLKYSAETISGQATKIDDNNNGEFKNCNTPVIKITFNQDANCDSGKILFKCDANSWKEVKNTFPSDGQNQMTVTITNEASSITWGTYTPSSPCDNCKTITK